MPGPSSATVSLTEPEAGSRPAAIVTVPCPPIASTALSSRFTSTRFIWSGSICTRGSPGSQVGWMATLEWTPL